MNGFGLVSRAWQLQGTYSLQQEPLVGISGYDLGVVVAVVDTAAGLQ